MRFICQFHQFSHLLLMTDYASVTEPNQPRYYPIPNVRSSTQTSFPKEPAVWNRLQRECFPGQFQLNLFIPSVGLLSILVIIIIFIYSFIDINSPHSLLPFLQYPSTLMALEACIGLTLVLKKNKQVHLTTREEHKFRSSIKNWTHFRNKGVRDWLFVHCFSPRRIVLVAKVTTRCFYKTIRKYTRVT